MKNKSFHYFFLFVLGFSFSTLCQAKKALRQDVKLNALISDTYLLSEPDRNYFLTKLRFQLNVSIQIGDKTVELETKSYLETPESTGRWMSVGEDFVEFILSAPPDSPQKGMGFVSSEKYRKGENKQASFVKKNPAGKPVRFRGGGDGATQKESGETAFLVSLQNTKGGASRGFKHFRFSSRLSDDQNQLVVTFSPENKRNFLNKALMSLGFGKGSEFIAEDDLKTSSYICEIREEVLECTMNYMANASVEDILDHIDPEDSLYKKILPYSSRFKPPLSLEARL